MPAQSWTLCHCVLRHQTPVLNAQTGEFETFLLLRLKDHRSDWAAFLGEAFFPCISCSLFPFPSRCSYCLTCLPLPLYIAIFQRNHVIATPMPVGSALGPTFDGYGTRGKGRGL